MKMRSSPMPPDSYRPRSEVWEQQPSLLSWEDSDAQNKMVSKAHHATYLNYDCLIDALIGELKERYFLFYDQDEKLFN